MSDPREDNMEILRSLRDEPILREQLEIAVAALREIGHVRHNGGLAHVIVARAALRRLGMEEK